MVALLARMANIAEILGSNRQCIVMDWNRLLIQLCFACWLAVFPAAAQENAGFPIAEWPAWAQALPVSALPQAEAVNQRDGIVWLLSDTQVRHRPGGGLIFHRITQKVTDRTGLEIASSFKVTFDPSLEKLKLVSLSISRDGIEIDHRHDARMDIYREEADQSQGILTGKKTVSVLIPDVRIGDIVDFAYVRDSGDMLEGLPFDYTMALSFTVPVARLRRRVTWPQSQPLSIKTFETGAKPAITLSGGNFIYEWNLTNPEVYPEADNLLPASRGQGWVGFSTAQNWQDVVRPLLAHYNPDAPLPDAYKTRLDAIAAKFPDAPDRLTEAVRLVQDEIRYVSLSIGYGAIVPRKPAEVIASGFGDCKDKALLLAAALQYLGIDAVAALTDLDGGEAIAGMPPSVMAFDHAIVRARLLGVDVWLDATDFSQGGRGFAIEQPHYGYALPLEVGIQEPAAMPAFDPVLATQLTEETYDLPVNDSGLLSIKVLTTYSRADADWFRRKVARDTPGELSKKYREYYANKFKGLVASADLGVTDNRDANIITTEENYEVPDFDRRAGETIRNFPVKGVLDLDLLPELSTADRKVPAYIGRPFHARHVTRVRRLGREYFHPDVLEKFERKLVFNASSTNRDGTFELTWDFKNHGGEILPSEIKSYEQARVAIGDGTNRLYDFSLQDENPEEISTSTMINLLVAFLTCVLALSGVLMKLRR